MEEGAEIVHAGGCMHLLSMSPIPEGYKHSPGAADVRPDKVYRNMLFLQWARIPEMPVKCRRILLLIPKNESDSEIE